MIRIKYDNSTHYRLPVHRNYEEEAKVNSCKRVAASNHPLETSRYLINNPITDPLSDPLSDPLLDPLSELSYLKVDVRSVKETNPAQNDQNPISEANNSWHKKKQQIMKDYSVDGSITFSSSTIEEISGSGVEDGSAARPLDKYMQRLAILERQHNNQLSGTIELSQKEYEAHIDRLSQELDAAWRQDERVKSLKIVIQLAKLLSDTANPRFYPAMFVMITSTLERFSEMVYQRLLNRAEEALLEESAGRGGGGGGGGSQSAGVKLPPSFRSTDVPSSAKDTCRNWFYKTACIKDLLPRVYVEITLLKCYRFLSDSEYPAILAKLGSFIRGLGDPLIAIYARAYLAASGSLVAPEECMAAVSASLLQDSLFSLSMLREPHSQSQLEKTKLSEKAYMHILSPGLGWISSCVGKKATREIFQSILQLYRDHSGDCTVLTHVLEHFDPAHYRHACVSMVALIKASTPSSCSIVDAFAALGKQLVSCKPVEEQRLPLLNDVWKYVSRSPTASLAELTSFVRCAAHWINVVQQHYGEKELSVLLSSLSQKLQGYVAAGNDLDDPIFQLLEAILASLIENFNTFGIMALTSDHLLKIVDLFPGPKKVKISEDIVSWFTRSSSSSVPSDDAVLLTTLFDFCRNLHDALDSLSPAAEVRQKASLLVHFIEKVDFGKNLEQQLNFYVECRAMFCNMDAVKDRLILCVVGLAMKAHKLVKAKHSKKTATFVKACFAYCHITIPSLPEVFRKLQLLLLCAEAALLNKCLPQTDTFLKAAISYIPEMPAETVDEEEDGRQEARLTAYLLSLLSFLVLLPGHPELGPFYIVRGLINAIPRFAWKSESNCQVRVQLGLLSLLCALYQNKLPYHIHGVDSNDALYCCSQSYRQELLVMIDAVVADISAAVVTPDRVENFNPNLKINCNRAIQGRLGLDFINQLRYSLELRPNLLLEGSPVVPLLLKLAETAQRNVQGGDMAYYRSTMQGLLSVLQSSVHPEQVTADRSNSSSNRKVLVQLERFLDSTAGGSAC